jgi:hypothetical protein
MNWRTINDFPSYEISEDGIVRRIDTKKVLAQSTKRGKRPYKRVHLSYKGVAKYVFVHRLVLTAFVGECPEGFECLHIDDDPTNNQLSNLQWGTRKLNHAAIDRKGQKNGRCKLTPQQVVAIRNSAETHAVLADIYNVARGYISSIKSGKTWKCIPLN